MGVSRQQLDGRRKSSSRKAVAFIKKQTARLNRRQGKRLLDNAPPRSTRGWDS